MSGCNKIFRFGVYEANSATGELRKSGTLLRLQDQPFQVLLVLLDRKGELVTRDELRASLWPADTFVDFDHNLNSIVNKLRDALNDSAANPRFIQTLARRGYRFLAPVEVIGDQPGASPQPPAPVPAAAPASASSAASLAGPASRISLLTTRDELPPVRREYIRVLFLSIQIMYLAFYIVALARLTFIEDIVQDALHHPAWAMALLIVSALVGVPLRLYLLASAAFDVKNLSHKFLRIFPAAFILDEIWSLAPLLLVPQIGWGLALAATAALIYVPFAQRTLLLMRDHSQPLS